ncbi:MAG: class I SAM-dependent methyltransferase [Thermoanaerobaculia bacterium]|nr:class I SAM-dependent methyltransferase [Thermoanaerobaculia bacterium]
MDVEYSRHYRDLHERHWWFRCRQRWVERHLERRLDGRQVGPILDIGAGDGLFLPLLARYGEAEGLEPEPEAVSEATRERWTLHLQPFDQSFDPGQRYGLITLFDVLEHLDHPVEALRHARSLLRPDGLLMLTVPALRLLWTQHDELNHHRTRYTRPELRAELEASGFQILECRYFYHWLVPIKLAVRGSEAIRGAEPEVPQVPGPFWNRLFYGITCVEQDVVSFLRLPFGSSILAIAKPR